MTPVDLVDAEAGPVWWCAWRYAERVSGIAADADAAAEAIEHFFDS